MRPSVVLGYSRELVAHTDVVGGIPRLFGRPAASIVNDRFLWNLTAAHGALDADAFLPANRCYEAGADKAAAYRHVNSYAARHRLDGKASTVRFDVCRDAGTLIETVHARLGKGEQVVIKPSGTGHGDGIEFFFGSETEEVIRERVYRSMGLVGERYGQGAGLPYTVAEYLDADVVRAPGHALHGCKFELRVVVYRHGTVLRAVPSIAKVAPEIWDPVHPTRAALINNISASVRGGKTSGADHVLPLCAPETLRTLDLDVEALTQLCGWATGYVAHVLAQLRPSMQASS